MPRMFWLLLALLLCVGCKQSGPIGMDAAAAASGTVAPDEALLDDVSGVWRSERLGALLYLLRDGDRFTMFVGSEGVSVRVGSVDLQQQTVNLRMPIDGRDMVWTVRKCADQASGGFHLVLTDHDGSQDTLRFIREVSDEDRRHLAQVAPSRNTGVLGSLPATNGVEGGADADAGSESESYETPGGEVEATDATEDEIAAAAAAAADRAMTGNNAPAYDWPVKTREGLMLVPRFDCGHPQNTAEQLVCSTPELTEMDRRMAGALHKLLAFSKQPAAERAIHQRWLTETSQRCTKVSCLRKAYEDRFRIFEGAHAYSEYAE